MKQLLLSQLEAEKLASIGCVQEARILKRFGTSLVYLTMSNYTTDITIKNRPDREVYTNLLDFSTSYGLGSEGGNK